MKQCPRCNRNYADDGLSFCLEDGAVLVKKYDANATLVNPYPPAPFVPPTVASPRAADTIPVQPQVPTRAPSPPAPAPSRRSPWLVGALVVVALAVGLTIGGYIVQRSTSSSTVSPNPELANNPSSTSTASPSPTSSASAPTPTPTSGPSPTSTVASSTPVLGPQCELFNNTALTVVTVRRDCDTRNCEVYADTKLDTYPDHTPVRVIEGSDVRTTNFIWRKVIITGSGRTVWVASTKIKCS